jgi:UPF0755 protein
MKILRRRNLVLALAGLFCAGTIAFFGVVAWALSQRPPAGDPVLFTVETGEPFSAIRDRLAAARLIEHEWAVQFYARARGCDRRIHAGTYRLIPGERPAAVLSALVTGDVYMVDVTIPEGFMGRQVAAALAAANVDSSAFVASLSDPRLLREVGIEAPSLEGYLFPDTYRLPWGIDPLGAARAMISHLDSVFDEGMLRRAGELSLTRHQVLTLASIIEAETQLDSERPLVSAVYHNRLRRGMRLEADPTVAFAMGGYKGRLFYRDLAVDSPYNTYKHRGLPPGPVCSPGMAAMIAALYPDTTSHAIYFVAQGDGGHIFSQTLGEHRAAINQVRRSRARK